MQCFLFWFGFFVSSSLVVKSMWHLFRCCIHACAQIVYTQYTNMWHVCYCLFPGPSEAEQLVPFTDQTPQSFSASATLTFNFHSVPVALFFTESMHAYWHCRSLQQCEHISVCASFFPMSHLLFHSPGLTFDLLDLFFYWFCLTHKHTCKHIPVSLTPQHLSSYLWHPPQPCSPSYSHYRQSCLCRDKLQHWGQRTPGCARWPLLFIHQTL